MSKTSIIHTRIDPVLKENVESILAQIGLTSSDAVNLLFKQIELNGGLPFELKIPNYKIEDEIYRAVKDSADQVKNGAKPIPAKDVFAKLDAKYAQK